MIIHVRKLVIVRRLVMVKRSHSYFSVSVTLFLVLANFPNNMRYFGTYVSKSPWDFMNYGAVRCDDLRFPGYSRVFRYQCRHPVIGQYVTVRNFDFSHPGSKPGIFYRMEINEMVILGKCEYMYNKIVIHDKLSRIR